MVDKRGDISVGSAAQGRSCLPLRVWPSFRIRRGAGVSISVSLFGLATTAQVLEHVAQGLPELLTFWSH